VDEDSSIRLLLTALDQPLVARFSLIFSFFLLFLLILINAFFAASEIAIITLNDNKIRKKAEEGDRIAIKLVRLINEPGSFLATIQVGVTLAGFLSSAFAADLFADRLYRLIGLELPVLRSVSVIVVTVILAYFSLVLGELVPKRVAQNNPEKIAGSVAGAITVLGIVLRPFVFLLTRSTNLILRLLGIDPTRTDRTVTEEEIRMMVDVGRESGNIHEEEKEMINNIFEFNDKDVSEIMTHRTNIVSLDVEADYAEVLEVAIHEKYTRIPVYEDNIDNIVGILHIKDLLYHAAEGLSQPFSLRNMIRPPCFVPESKSIDSLLREMKRDRIQMSVVIDEYGGTAGIVTIEDLLEEIVGNIQDEYDEEELEIVRKDETTWLVSGMADLDEVGDAVGVRFPDEDYETLAGFVISLLGWIPDENQVAEVTYENLTLKVMEMDEKRISTIQVTVTPPVLPPESTET
jgi:putative hemolysin